jgi:hypothetical protein
MTGAGLASPVVSMIIASNLLRLLSSLLTVLIRSPRTVGAQQSGQRNTQPGQGMQCTHMGRE